MKTLRRYLVAGLLIWIPVGITIFVISVLMNLTDQALLLIPSKFRPENLLGVNIPGLGFVFAFILLLLTSPLYVRFIMVLGKSLKRFLLITVKPLIKFA